MPKGKARLKAVVDEYLHRPGRSLARLTIEVEDRLAVHGVRTIGGVEVGGAHGGFLDLRDGGRVPFHRVVRVRDGARVVYERPR